MTVSISASMVHRSPGYGSRRLVAILNIAVPHLGAAAGAVIAIESGVRMQHVFVAGILFVLTAGIGTEVGLHRLFTHRAFNASAHLRRVLALLGCMAAQGSVVFWAGTHRQHHAMTDRDGDPHSPHLHGLRIPTNLGSGSSLTWARIPVHLGTESERSDDQMVRLRLAGPWNRVPSSFGSTVP